MEFKHSEIEAKWRVIWAEQELYRTETDTSKPKCYVLDMFPYPSGAGLHVGHPLGYIASDIFARFKRLQGFNVLHPMGFDSFGLPAEQYAIETGRHPSITTEKNSRTYRQQLESLGLSFDWSRQISTSDPQYYKWTQWIFIQMFNHYYNTALQCARPIEELEAHFAQHGSFGHNAHNNLTVSFTAQDWAAMSPTQRDQVLMCFRIAYRDTYYVNWCEALGTVLANDEVVNGLSERGGHPVERVPMKMWNLRTTAYAERLLKGLDQVDYPEALKEMQRNWIGRSTGANVFFEIEGHAVLLEVFTTRPDTLFGVTFMVLAPEHDLVEQITTSAQRKEIDTYLQYVKTRSELDRMSDVKRVTGAFTGAYATHPITSEPLPIYISEYVLKDYGTGAIMAVPADDERDRRFAEKFGLPIIEIIDKSAYPGATIEDKVGHMINSGFLNGMEVPDAIEAMCRYLDQQQIGGKRINYKLRDAAFSRQRYWGEPLPVVYTPDGVTKTLPIEQLPLELPYTDNFKSVGKKGPLQGLPDWWQLPDGSIRETDTMPGFAGSSWYYLRFMDPHNPDAFADQKHIQYWQDVDFYIGGAEHAVGHLLYSRMYHKFLRDLQLVPTEEPYRRLFNQGMIQSFITLIVYYKPENCFISSDIADRYNPDDCAEFLIKAEMVSDYGMPGSAHLTDTGIEAFKNWRKEFAATPFIKSPHQPDKFFVRSEVGKMSKSKHNVVNPDEIIEKYGADALRLFEMFLGPIEQSKPWNTSGITGVTAFLRKLWSLFFNESGLWLPNDLPPTADDERTLHQCIKKVTEDIERISLNTCVSHFMVAVNELKKSGCASKAILSDLLILIAPFAPFITEELWHRLGHTTSIHTADWPAFDPSKLVTETVAYPVCINGKRRAELVVPNGMSQTELQAQALELPPIQKWLDGQTPKKVIIVPNRMINIVV